MKKLQTRIIILLIAVTLVSSVLANILSWTLAPIIFEGQTREFVEMFGGTVQTGITLIFFAIFVMLIIRELLQPIGCLSQAARRIAEGDLNVQLPKTKRTDEIGELEQNFRRMVIELRSNEAMEKDFIQNVSHEFKTPLSVISGYARMLEQDELEPQEMARCSRNIVEETARLSGMITNILLLSKLDNTGIRPTFTSFLLDEQLRQATLQVEPAWRAKRISLDLELEQATVYGSEELLCHVWLNLLDNAIKFSDTGGTVHIRLENADGMVRVAVADNGIGMSQETVDHVFDQFYQGDTSHFEVGSGLGLPLVKRIVDLHEGGIIVSSEPEKGTEFTVTLYDPARVR